MGWNFISLELLGAWVAKILNEDVATAGFFILLAGVKDIIGFIFVSNDIAWIEFV